MTANTSPVRDLLGLLLAEVSPEMLLDYTRSIAQWERLSGSEDERRAFDYVETVLRDVGLQTERYAPVCLVSLPVSASLTLTDTGERIPCITHSFSTSTGAWGITAELVDAAAGAAADYAAIDARGKIALTDGLAGPGKVPPAEAAGVAGVISANRYEVHDMIVSPVWGSPDPSNIDRLPTVPHISIDGAGGRLLRERLAAGPVRVRITTEVDTGWRPLPVLIAHLQPDEPVDDFVMLSGHIDSWYLGAMDNGAANAAMIETARVLAAHRDLLRRSLRLAFWSGHSHGRYATSAWYADEFWQELHDHCVAHVNIDSPGAVGASEPGAIGAMAESYTYSRALLRQLCGVDLPYQRIGRGGDQSFWGIGIPSVCGKVYHQPDSGEGRTDLSGSFGWWWHTPDDTMDKIDPTNLARDAGILLAAVYTMAAEPVLPYDQTVAVDEVLRALGEIAAAGDALDLAPERAEAAQLRVAAARLTERVGRPAGAEQAARLNACQLAVSHLLIPVNYTSSGPFGQDPALSGRPLPGLRPSAPRAGLGHDRDERQLRLTALRRERNRLRHALVESRRQIESTLAAVGE